MSWCYTLSDSLYLQEESDQGTTVQGASHMALVAKNPPANAGDVRDPGSTPGLGRSPEGGHGSPLQHSCLENAMGRGAWWAAVHRVAKSRTRLSHSSGGVVDTREAGQHQRP